MRLVTTDGATPSSRAAPEKLRRRATRRNAFRFSRLLMGLPPNNNCGSRASFRCWTICRALSCDVLRSRKLIALYAAFCPARIDANVFLGLDYCTTIKKCRECGNLGEE